MCVKHQQIDLISINCHLIFANVDVAPLDPHFGVQILVGKHISMQLNFLEVRAQVFLVFENFVGKEFCCHWVNTFGLTCNCNRLTTDHWKRSFSPGSGINHHCFNPAQIFRNVCNRKHEVFTSQIKRYV